jgi:1,4-alpha-glucan branching enzyme
MSMSEDESAVLGGAGVADVAVEMSDVEHLVSGRHRAPQQVLGAHPERGDGADRVVIRAWRADAVEMAVLALGQRIPMRRVHPAGVFTGVLGGSTVPRYRLEATLPGGAVERFEDPYGSPRSGPQC